MAEIAGGGGDHKKGGKKRAKKLSTRIDMTPMVDLGFLLLTFFVLVSTFSKPTSMDMALPAKPDINDPAPPDIRQSRVIQVFLSDNDKIYLMKDVKDKARVDSCDFKSTKAMREPFLKFMSEIKRDYSSTDSAVVLIKPMNKSNYGNFVGILDEMAFMKVQRYTIAEMAKTDSLDLLAARNRR
jgi:biopolymer transport protein ExbD